MPEPATRAERFRIIRDAIMSTLEDAPYKDVFCLERLLAPFKAHYFRNVPGYGPHNLQIWSDAKVDAECGWMLEMGSKVANVSWDDDGDVEITSYKSGQWEQDIVALIENGFEMDSTSKRLRDKALSLIDGFGEVDLGGDEQPLRTMEFGRYRMIYGVPCHGTPANLRILLRAEILFGIEWTDDDAAVRAIMGGTWQNDFLRSSSPAPYSLKIQ